MKKAFDAVQMVRDIRDKIYAETRGLSMKEKIDMYRQAAKRVNGQKRLLKPQGISFGFPELRVVCN